MSKKVVIYLLDSVFNQRHAERIGVDFFNHSNIDLFVWECIFYRSIPLPETDKFSSFSANVVRISSIGSLNIALNDLQGRDVIFLNGSLGVDFYSRLIRFLVKKRGFKIGLVNVVHLVKPYTNIVFEILNKFNSVNGVLKRTVNLLLKVTLPSERFDFLISAGSTGIDYSIDKRIETCSFDVAFHNRFDAFEFNDLSKIRSDNRYIVFLDNGSYFHPDQDACHLRLKGNSTDFIKKIKSFFFDIQIEMNAKLVIAAHPKMPKEYYFDVFPEFQVEFDNTASLVKGAFLTCMVFSNSAGFSVLSKKPIIILTDYNHKRSYIDGYQRAFADELSCPIINLDQIIPPIQLPIVNDNLYDDYISKYMSSKDCLLNKSVFLPFINAVFNEDI